MKKIITYLCILLSGGICYQLYANLNGASSQTGASNIGELSCSQSGCHGAGNGENSLGGLADNMGGGSVVISGIGGTYTPGTVYHVTVTVNQTGAGRFGFNAEILDASGGNVGTYSITQTGTWLRSGMNGTRQGVSQGHSGSTGSTAGIGNDSFDFYFDWTAPATSVGPITITASGLAINQSTLNDSGDQVYTASLTVNPSTSTAAQILISRSTFNFPSFYSLPNTAGNSQVFWTAGQSLTGNITASVTGSQFMIASSASGPWVTSIPLTASGGVVNATPIYVQYTGPASGTQTGTVTVSGGGAASKSIPLSGIVRTGGTAPTINPITPSSINFGSVAVGSGNTAPQTFTFSFANPVGSLTVACPPPFEVSTVPTYDYTHSLSPNFAGMGFTFVAYVRMTNPKTVGTYTGNLTIAMPGATTQSLSLSGSSTMPSQLVLSNIDYLSLFTTNPGTPSATQTISVNGTGLTANLNVSAPNNFEVSLSSSTGFASSVSIAPVSGNVAPTTVYARYNRSTAGLDAGNVTISSSGAATQSVYINGDCFGSPSTTVKTVSKENGVAIFPNPSTGIIYVRTSNQTKDLFISVLDISGKTILMERLSSENEKIDLSNCPAGVYFAGIVDGNMNIIAREKVVLAK